MLTKSRVILGAVASIATAGMLAGCSPAGEANTDVDLRMVMWSSNPDHLALFQGMADEFMEEHPNVTGIEFESINVAEIDTVLTTQLAGGTPPDLSWLPVESSQEYIGAGALVNVQETLESTEGYDYEDLIPELQQRWKTDEGQFGVPFSTSPFAMFFNKDVYAAAGIPNPQEMADAGDWTWDSFRAASKTIADTQGVPGYVINDFDFQNWTRLLPVMNAYGASPWNEDATECTADSAEMVDAMTFFTEMVYDDQSTPAPGEQADFWGGQAGATSAFLSSNSLLSEAPFGWGIAPMPSGPAGSEQSLAQAAIVAYSAGENQEAATQFLAFLTNPENAAKLARFFPPARESLLTPETIAAASPLLTEELVAPIVEAVVETGEIFPVAPNAAAVADALDSTLDEHVYGSGADIAAGLGQVCSVLNPLLSE